MFILKKRRLQKEIPIQIVTNTCCARGIIQAQFTKIRCTLTQPTSIPSSLSSAAKNTVFIFCLESRKGLFSSHFLLSLRQNKTHSQKEHAQAKANIWWFLIDSAMSTERLISSYDRSAFSSSHSLFCSGDAASSSWIFDELPTATVVSVSRPDASDITPLLLSYNIELQYKQVTLNSSSSRANCVCMRVLCFFILLRACASTLFLYVCN